MESAADSTTKPSKNSEGYGRPKPGTLTEKRAKEASAEIAKEMMYLCEVIRDYGTPGADGRITITFGKLFSIYQYISDKLLGMLIRARKHKMVDFEGEMLFQKRDDHVVIKLLMSNDELARAFAEKQ
ncbi:unnamed protein product [Nippostrongylus brasiliensis]|uniref:Actin-binding Rho-activating protein (inferred by orthology to a human protein) n=1 Tax=Nippostrongylus brasiliensis TaxID=27835 RepID=A0A0N4XZT3_NIPBR|nr:hypothetical protein Q1695_009022 [Nippostrongylus brasiliensis]VDL72308.1 unnamed protein product [Nippostrongylus brasiliensis]